MPSMCRRVKRIWVAAFMHKLVRDVQWAAPVAAEVAAPSLQGKFSALGHRYAKLRLTNHSETCARDMLEFMMTECSRATENALRRGRLLRQFAQLRLPDFQPPTGRGSSVL